MPTTALENLTGRDHSGEPGVTWRLALIWVFSIIVCTQHLAPHLGCFVHRPFIANWWTLPYTSVFHLPRITLRRGTSRGWGSLHRASVHCITGPRSWASRRSNGPSLGDHPCCSSSCFRPIDSLLCQNMLQKEYFCSARTSNRDAFSRNHVVTFCFQILVCNVVFLL